MNMKSNLSRATRISGRTTSAGWSEELWRVDMSGTELPCSYGQRVRGAPESLKNVTLKRLFIPGHAVSGIQTKNNVSEKYQLLLHIEMFKYKS